MKTCEFHPIPYWMTHFEGWENTWTGLDEYAIEGFIRKTGLDARKDLKLGDSIGSIPVPGLQTSKFAQIKL